MYNLQISEEQAQVISRCTEFFARVQMGQLEDVFYQLMDSPKFLGLSVDERQALRSLLAEAGQAFTKLGTGASFGIRNEGIPEAARVAWDLYQVIRQVLAWKRQPTGGDQVQFSDPMQVAGTELAHMEKGLDK